jgi:hypothetical protein
MGGIGWGHSLGFGSEASDITMLSVVEEAS